MKTVPARDLHEFAVELLAAGGFAPNFAEDSARVLVWVQASRIPGVSGESGGTGRDVRVFAGTLGRSMD